VTDRLDAVKARLDTVDQLGLVMNAMRSIAAARVREARTRLDGIRAYAGTIATAIGESLALLTEPLPAPALPAAVDLVIALTAEQGFAGAFSGRVLAQAREHVANGGPGRPTELFLVGDRGLMIAPEHGLEAQWSVPMAANADEIPALADRISGALFTRLAAGRAMRVTMIHSEPDPSGTGSVVERALLPFDYGRFPVGTARVPPLTSLPSGLLNERLAEEYVFAEICEALMLSFAAENEARMRAMVSAQNNVRRRRESLQAEYRRLRQEQITTEILELAAGRATRDRNGARRDPQRIST